MSSFMFNDVDYKNRIIVNKKPAIILPQRENRIVDIPDMDGVHYNGYKYGPLIIPLQITILADTRQELWNEIIDIAGKLHTENPENLFFSDLPNLYFKAVVSGMTSLEDLYASFGEGEISFLCPSPLKYGVERNFSFDNDQLAINNNGSAPALPIFTCTFTSSASDIEINNGEKYIRIVREFSQGDRLTLDHATKKVIYNDNVQMNILDWQSDFFTLNPGHNVLTVEPGNVANVDVIFRERWR